MNKWFEKKATREEMSFFAGLGFLLVGLLNL
jgi:hypothetical protein